MQVMEEMVVEMAVEMVEAQEPRVLLDLKDHQVLISLRAGG